MNQGAFFRCSRQWKTKLIIKDYIPEAKQFYSVIRELISCCTITQRSIPPFLSAFSCWKCCLKIIFTSSSSSWNVSNPRKPFIGANKTSLRKTTINRQFVAYALYFSASPAVFTGFSWDSAKSRRCWIRTWVPGHGRRRVWRCRALGTWT